MELLLLLMTSSVVLGSRGQRDVVETSVAWPSDIPSASPRQGFPRLRRRRHLLNSFNETLTEKDEDAPNSTHHSRTPDEEPWIFWVQNIGLLGGVLALCYCRCYRLPPSRRADAYTELVIQSDSRNARSGEDVSSCLEFCAAKGCTRLSSDPTSSFYAPLAIPHEDLSTGAVALSGAVKSAAAVEGFQILKGRLLDSVTSRIMEFHGPLTVDAHTIRLAAVDEISSRVDFYARLLVKPSIPSPKEKSNSLYDVAYGNVASVVDRQAMRKLERTKLELGERCERWRRLASSPDLTRTLDLLSNSSCTWQEFDPGYVPNSSRLSADADYVRLWTPIDSRAAAVALGIVVYVLDVESRTIEKFEPNRDINHRRLRKLQGPCSDSKSIEDALDDDESWDFGAPNTVFLLQYSRLHYAALVGSHATLVDLPSLPRRTALASRAARRHDKDLLPV